jgi:hypothetical protein
MECLLKKQRRFEKFWAVRRRPDRLNIGWRIGQLSFPHTGLRVVMAPQCQ